MAGMRHPLQGVTNIVRFNWHFYILAVVGTLLGLLLAYRLGGVFITIGWGVALAVIGTTLTSLLVSWYVYDYSDLYRFEWVDLPAAPQAIVNIHAGFDETSDLLAQHYPDAQLRIFDFYHPEQHTEVSIRRARAAYPGHPDTEKVATDQLPLSPASVDLVFLTLAAHEIRDDHERAVCLASLRRALRPGGRIIVTEHLRDAPNFLAYTLGFLHFLSRSTWLSTFAAAELKIVREQKVTPFITVFNLVPNDLTP